MEKSDLSFLKLSFLKEGLYCNVSGTNACVVVILTNICLTAKFKMLVKRCLFVWPGVSFICSPTEDRMDVSNAESMQKNSLIKFWKSICSIIINSLISYRSKFNQFKIPTYECRHLSRVRNFNHMSVLVPQRTSQMLAIICKIKSIPFD